VPPLRPQPAAIKRSRHALAYNHLPSVRRARRVTKS
jgi:hypothetical protein